MAMTNKGLSKLVEEMGELNQVIGKMLQYPDLMCEGQALHPDGTHLRSRLEEEMADVLCAARFVAEKMNLDITKIYQRQIAKEMLFKRWDAGEDAEPRQP